MHTAARRGVADERDTPSLPPEAGVAVAQLQRLVGPVLARWAPPPTSGSRVQFDVNLKVGCPRESKIPAPQPAR